MAFPFSARRSEEEDGRSIHRVAVVVVFFTLLSHQYSSSSSGRGLLFVCLCVCVWVCVVCLVPSAQCPVPGVEFRVKRIMASARKSSRRSLPMLFGTSQRGHVPNDSSFGLAHDLDLYYIRQIASHMKVRILAPLSVFFYVCLIIILLLCWDFFCVWFLLNTDKKCVC